METKPKFDCPELETKRMRAIRPEGIQITVKALHIIREKACLEVDRKDNPRSKQKQDDNCEQLNPSDKMLACLSEQDKFVPHEIFICQI